MVTNVPTNLVPWQLGLYIYIYIYFNQQNLEKEIFKKILKYSGIFDISTWNLQD